MTKYVVDCAKIPGDIEGKKVSAKPGDENLAKFGALIIDLALGNKTIPPDLKDQRKLLEDENGGNLIIHPDVKVELVQQKTNDIKIIVPPIEMIQKAICDMQELDDEISNGAVGKSYVGLPDAYEEMTSGDWIKDKKSMELFYEIRVADYTLGYCR